MSRTGLRRLVFLLVGLGLIAGVGGVLVWQNQGAQQRRLAAARDEGIRLTESGEYAAGLEVLSPVVATDRDDAEALLAFAECRIRVDLPNGKHVSAAVAAARLALDDENHRLKALRFLIPVYGAMGFQQELLDACAQMLALDPTDRAALEARVSGLIALNRLDDAEEAARDYADQYPDEVEPLFAAVEVQRARGLDGGAIDAFVRSEKHHERLGDRAAYHLLAAGTAATAAIRGVGQGQEDSIARAVASATRAAALDPTDPSIAFETTEMLRRLAEGFGIASLEKEADDTVRRRLAGDAENSAYGTLESRAAWWRGDQRFAREIARTLRDGLAANSSAQNQPTADERAAALGWIGFVSDPLFGGEGERGEFADSLDTRGSDSDLSDTTRYWQGLHAALSGIREGASPGAVESFLAGADDAAARLDARGGLRDHAPLLAMVRAEALVRGGQRVSASSVLERAAGSDENSAENSLRPDVTRTLLAASRSVRALGEGASRTNGDEPLSIDALSAQVAADPGEAELAARYAVALLMRGSAADGLAEARRALMLLDEDDAEAGTLERLAGWVSPHDQELAEQLIERGLAAHPGSLELLVAAAEMCALRGDPEAGVILFDEAIAASGIPTERTDGSAREANTLRLLIQRASFIESQGVGDPLEAWASVSREFPASGVAQNAVLDSKAVMQNEALVREAVGRLRAAAGEESLEWRIASLRADLAFLPEGPSERERALAETNLKLAGVVERAPEHAPVHRLRAIAFDLAGEPREAVRSLSRAASADEGYFPELIRYLISRGFRGEALREAERFAALPAGSLPVSVLAERAELLEALGLLPEAVADRRLLAGGGGSDAIAALGRLLVRLGDTRAAAELGRGLLAPGRPRRVLERGAGLLIEAGLADEAQDLYIAARSTGDGGVRADAAREEIAGVLLRRGAWAEAASVIRELVRENGGAQNAAEMDRWRVMGVHALLESGDTVGAANLVATMDASASDAVRAIGTALGETGNPEDGVQTYRLARALAALRATGGDGLAGIAARFEGVLLGSMPLVALREDLAARAHDPGVRFDERYWQARLAAGPDDTAAAALAEAADALPTVAWPLRQLAMVQLGAGDLEGAMASAHRLAQRNPADTFDADTVRARVEHLQGDREALVRWLLPHREALERGRGGSDARVLLAQGLIAEGRGDEADGFVRACVERDPSSAALLLDAALAALQGGRGPRGESVSPERVRGWLRGYEGAVASSAGETLAEPLGVAWSMLAQRTGSAADAVRAVEVLEPIVLADPGREDGPMLGMHLASADRIAGDAARAASRYVLLLEAHPESVPLRNNYASLLQNDMGDAGAARAEAARALGLARAQGVPAGGCATVAHTLAAACRADGDAGEAEAVLRSAIKEFGWTPELAIELGEILAEQGDAGGARDVLRALMEPREAGRLPADLRERATRLASELAGLSMGETVGDSPAP